MSGRFEDEVPSLAAAAPEPIGHDVDLVDDLLLDL
jgi:hypothetical protein